MKASFIQNAHNVEQKRVSIVIECFVIKKQFCKKTEILSVRLVFPPIDLEKRNWLLSVDFVSWRMAQCTLERKLVGKKEVRYLIVKLTLIRTCGCSGPWTRFRFRFILWFGFCVPLLALKCFKVHAMINSYIKWIQWSGIFLSPVDHIHLHLHERENRFIKNSYCNFTEN